MAQNPLIAPPQQSTPQPSTAPPAEPIKMPSEQQILPNSPLEPTGQQPQESHKKTSIAIVSIIILVLLAFGGAVYGVYAYLQSTTTNSAPNIKVGLMMAFSGGSATMGYGVNTGVQLAKKQLNASNIEIVQVDSKCDPKTAQEAVKTLIDQNVVAIIGEGCSSATVAALPAVNNAKIPLISPSASSPTLSIPNDYFFRVVPPDTMQGAFMANTIYDKGYHNVAIFYTNEPYGSGMNNAFRESFEALGGQVVANVTAEPDVIDVRTQMEQVKAANPEALFIAPNSAVSATAVINVAREIGMTIPFFGADIMYSSAIVTDAPQASEGVTVSTFPTGTSSFRQSLFNETQKNEQLYAAPQAYDIIHVLQIAAQKGGTTGEKIKNILPSIEFDGMSGHIKFDANGEITDKTYKYDLFQVKNGTFTLLE